MHVFNMALPHDFYSSVYEIVRLIPLGRVTTYGAIARALGSSQSSRMVGWAMNASHNHVDIPAHRVVNRNGLLTGKMHFESPDAMQGRLEQEGIIIQNNQIVDFQKYFWDPISEL